MLSDSSIKVSVSMITYNHEKFIAKALDSVLMQKTDFDFEIVIGEDCSTDQTREIVIDYQKRNPDRMRLILSEKNLGASKNAEQVSRACKGKYVALLEGDDYWTSPDKLQKQVDFLDNHLECSFCFHNVMIVYADGNRDSRNYCPEDQKEISTLEDLIFMDFIPTCSTMYRRGLFQNFPDWTKKVTCGDWALHILNAQHGKIGYLNEILGAFLSHSGGVWSRLSKENVDMEIIAFYDKLKPNLELKYRKIIHSILQKRCYELSRRFEDIGDFSNAKKYARKCLINHFLFNREVIKALMRLHVPNLYKILMHLKRAVYFPQSNT